MATRIVEGKKPYTGGKAITVDENKVISLNLRDENNLIIYDEGDDEIYVDLQLDDEITPTSAFPIGVNVGRVIVDNGWDKPGTIISAETTSGDNIKIFYADEGTLWIDNGTGTFKQIYFKADVDTLLLALRNYIDGELAKKQNGVSSDTAPENPSEGDLWYDTVHDALKVYDGTNWNAAGGGGGGDVVVSTDTGNELTTGVGLWLGTETDFSSISTPDTNTLYIQYKSDGGGGWDMNNWALAQTSSALSGNRWGGISMNADGTKMYLSGSGAIREYSLSTAYDISSFTQIASISTSVEDIYFKPDGTKLYALISNGATVVEYTLSTPWDLSTATQTTTKNVDYNGRGLYITPDGTKLFESRHQDNNSTSMATMSTPRDLSTLGSTSTVLNYSGLSCFFGANGSLYFTQINESTSDLTYMTCSTPYDLSTATITGTKTVGACMAGGIWFNTDGTICMMVGGGSSTNYVTKYTL